MVRPVIVGPGLRSEAKQPAASPGTAGARSRLPGLPSTPRRIVMVDYKCQRDGSIMPLGPLRSRCVACGQVTESIVEVVRPYEDNVCPEDQRVAG